MRTASPDHPVSIDEIRQLAKARFGDMVKAVVDLKAGDHAARYSRGALPHTPARSFAGPRHPAPLPRGRAVRAENVGFIGHALGWCTPRDPMMEPTHRDLAAGAWWDLSLAEQLGNIGSEISRAERWRTRNPEISRGAFFRALELLDLTLDDPRVRESRARLREIARAREVVADYFFGPNQYGSSGMSLLKYFDAFALVARRQRSRR